MKKSEEVSKMLDENIPEKAVRKREGGGGRKLSYLETWYVIDRLNQVFGNMNWDSYTDSVVLVPGETTKYMAKVKIVAKTDGVFCTKEGYGFGDAQKGSRVDHELAIKEAESDALKRAAMKFGRSMGLALYDKTQEFVGEAETETEPVPAPSTQTGAVSAKKDTAQLKEIIKNSARILIDTKKITKPKFVEKYIEGFGATKVDSMDEAAVTKAYKALAADFPELRI